MGSLPAEQAKLLGEMFRRYGPSLVLYARQWLPDAAADSAVPAPFLRLMALRREPEHVRAFLYRCVRNAAVDAMRTRRRQAAHEAQASVAAAAGRHWLTAQLDDQLDAARVAEVLGTLPLEQREVVVMRLWGQLPFREIAAVTGAPISTLHSRYAAALEALRRKVEPPCPISPARS